MGIYGGGNVFTDGRAPFALDQSFGSAKATNLAAPAAGGDATNKTYVDAAIAAAFGGLGSLQMSLVGRSAAQSNGSSPATVVWQSSITDSGGINDIGGAHPERQTIQVTGYYMVIAQTTINDGAFGGMLLVVKNGATNIGAMQTTMAATTYGTNAPWQIAQAGPLLLTAGDYITCTTSGLSGAGAHTTSGASCGLYLIAANAPGGGDFLSDGSIPMTGDLDFGGQQGINLGTPSASTDAATKGYVDTQVATVTAANAYAKATAIKTNGNVAAGTLADIAGLSVTFTMSNSGIIEARFTGSYSFNSVVALTVVISVDGTEYSFTGLSCIVGAGSDAFTGGTVSLAMPVSVSAGSHTVKMRQSGVNATLLANATSGNHPACLTVDYQP